jgi:glycosyltransferase involved in cell wall biosynthesis
VAKKFLEIITSAYNEEECVKELFSRIEKVMQQHVDYEWRIIFCDNDSTDHTWELIQELSTETAKVLGVRMSKTFTLDAAFTMGIDIATADAIVIMASDLQDPPEVIHTFIEKYEQGYEQVAGMLPRGQQLADIYKQDPYTQAVAEAETFGTAGSAVAKEKRRKLTALETAAFAGSSGAAQNALSRDRASSVGMYRESGAGSF